MTEWLLLRKLDSIIQIDIHKMGHDKQLNSTQEDSLWRDEESSTEESTFNEGWDISNIYLEDKKEKKDKKERKGKLSYREDEDDVYW